MPKLEKELQEVLAEGIQTISRVRLGAMLRKKLAAAGADVPLERTEAWAAMLLVGDVTPFDIEEIDDDDGLEIALSERDLAELLEEIEKTVSEVVPNAIASTVAVQGKSLARLLRRRWPAEFAAQEGELGLFRERLRERWRKPFDTLRMLITCSREIGQEAHKRGRRFRRPERKAAAELLVRMHARAVLTACEITTLMENGFADGAMARWRTLYEITVVATLIAERGGDLPQRYQDHQAISALEALREYDLNHGALGYPPFGDAERRDVETAAAEAVSTYGAPFATPYGWAAAALQNRRPTFAQVEATVGYRHMRSFYKLSSYNVHAGPRGLYFRHGLLKGSDVILAGPSNAGFHDAAQRTAASLVAITALLLDMQTLDGLISSRSLLEIVKNLGRDLAQAERRLAADDAALRKPPRRDRRRGRSVDEA